MPVNIPDELVETAMQVDEEEDQGETPESEGSERSTGKKPGIDRVLRDVEEQLGGEYSEVIRGLQREFTQNGEVEAMRRQLREAIDEVNVFKGQLTEAPDDEDDPLKDVPQEQLDTLFAVLEKAGYVKADDLTEAGKAAYATESNVRAVERFGDDFGIVDPDTGEVVINDATLEELSSEYDRIVNQGNVTFEDLYVSRNIDSIIQDAFLEGVRKERERLSQDNDNRVARIQRTQPVAVSSSGGHTEVPAYDTEKLKQMTPMNRISHVMREIREQRRP